MTASFFSETAAASEGNESAPSSFYKGSASYENITAPAALADAAAASAATASSAASAAAASAAAAAASEAAIAGSTGGAALTKTDDTNVTLTLGGTPATALLKAASITVGWASTLAPARGGFGADVSASSGVPLFTTGVPTFTGTSGTGNFARVTSPTLVTPTLGAATATSINKMAITAPATSSTLVVADGKTLTASNTLTLAGTDSTTITFQGTDTYVGRATTDTITGVKTFNDAKLVLAGSSSGTTTLKSGAAAGTSVITLPIATDTLVGKATTDTLTNKTLTAPTIAGGTHTALTSLGIRSTGAAFDLTLAATSVYTAGRTLTLATGDAARTFTLSGDLTVNGGTAITPGVAGQIGVWSAGTLSGSATPTLGASGTLGSLAFGNATSGTVTLQPVTGTLGSAVVSLPAATDTLVGKATTDTLTNKTFDTAGTGNVLKINGTGVSAITGTGAVMLAASPTTTGTLTGAAANFSGAVTFGTGTITGLTNKASPDGVNDYVIIYDNAGTAIKKAAVGTLGSGSGTVSSFNALTGAVAYNPFGVGMVNGTIVESHTSNAATFTIKTLAGATPSASDPVFFMFRNATLATGDYTVRTVTSALSVTIPSTATMGATSAVGFRIWLVAVDTGSGVELGVVNCALTGGIFQLSEGTLVSPTATPASTAGVIYTTSGQTSKPFRIVGYATYETGLTTAGTWAASPTVLQLFGPGVSRPGTPTGTNSFAAGLGSGSNSTATPADVTGGSLSITPSSSVNSVRYSFTGVGQALAGGAGTNSTVNVQILRGSTVIGTAQTVGVISASGTNMQSLGTLTFAGIDRPASSTSTTYKAQVSNPQATSASSYVGINIMLEELQG